MKSIYSSASSKHEVYIIDGCF